MNRSIGFSVLFGFLSYLAVCLPFSIETQNLCVSAKYEDAKYEDAKYGNANFCVPTIGNQKKK